MQAVLYLHYKDVDDVDTVELLENESIESAGVVVLHDKITPAKSATSLLRRLMEAKLLKTKTAVLVLYSGRTLLTREQDPRESEMSGRVRQGLQVIVWVFVSSVCGVQKYIGLSFLVHIILWPCTASVCSSVYRKLHHSRAYHDTTTPEPQTTCALDLLCSRIT